MKQNINITLSFLVLLLSLSTLTSCEDWLDVSPKTQIKGDDNFSSEQGFKDALTGVYLQMTETSVYGQELTYGMIDAMAQYYTGLASASTYNYDMAFDYSNASCENRINAVWSKMYAIIANDNELIKQIDAAHSTIFTGRNRHLIRGEAYALRAFLHFDLARLWGESYAANKNDKCIPYMTMVTADVYPLSTVEEVMQKALADLKIAEGELSVDPVIAGNAASSADDANYERNRTFKMNFYAVKLLQARIYLYMKDYVKAREAADAVIAQGTFFWTPEIEINTSESSRRNSIFSEELVFCLYDTSLRTRYSNLFTGSINSLKMDEKSYQAIYELYNPGFSGDYRYAYQNVELDGAHYSTKLQQPTSGNPEFMFRIPMMRLSEAYYIAAECALEADGNVAEALDLLNVVRRNRNLTDDLMPTLSLNDAREELRKEYTKEFMCEGQLYYFFKRKNYESIPVYSAIDNSVSINYVTPRYTFPLPDDEMEYGGREGE